MNEASIPTRGVPQVSRPPTNPCLSKEKLKAFTAPEERQRPPPFVPCAPYFRKLCLRTDSWESTWDGAYREVKAIAGNKRR
jgi:hypothetical protein